MYQNSCIPGVSCCIFVFHAEDDFKKQERNLKTKSQTNNLHLKSCLCLQNKYFNTPSGPDRETRVSRSLLVRFPLTSRQVLVRLSFVSRSLFVSLSKTERGPNEEQAKNERKSNEYRSRCRRETIGNSTSSHRHGWQNTLLQPQTSILPLTLLLPRQKAALSALPRHSHGESSLFHPFCTFHPPQKPLAGSKNTSPPHGPTTTKDTPYPS